MLPPVVSYREYLAWVAIQDGDTARVAWAAELAGVDEPTLVAPTDRGVVLPERVALATGPELADGLRETARATGVTVNTLVQGAWALVLSRLAGRSDVVFGATVSGRPAELAGWSRWWDCSSIRCRCGCAWTRPSPSLIC